MVTRRSLSAKTSTHRRKTRNAFKSHLQEAYRPWCIILTKMYFCQLLSPSMARTDRSSNVTSRTSFTSLALLTFGDYPFERCMYESMQRDYYSLQTANDVYTTHNNYQEGVCNRQAEKHRYLLHECIPRGSLEFSIPPDILRLIQEMLGGRRIVLVATYI